MAFVVWLLMEICGVVCDFGCVTEMGRLCVWLFCGIFLSIFCVESGGG